MSEEEELADMLHDNSSNEADEKGPARYRGGIDVAERVKEKRCCIIHNYYICRCAKRGTANRLEKRKQDQCRNVRSVIKL